MCCQTALLQRAAPGLLLLQRVTLGLLLVLLWTAVEACRINCVTIAVFDCKMLKAEVRTIRIFLSATTQISNTQIAEHHRSAILFC